MNKRTVLSFLGVVVFSILLAGCSTDDGSAYEDPASVGVTIVMTNQTNQEIHMWGPTESMGAGNKVAPYGERIYQYTFYWMPGDWLVPQTVTISAGRNGAILYTVSDSFDCYAMPRSQSAVWDGTRIIWSYKL